MKIFSKLTLVVVFLLISFLFVNKSVNAVVMPSFSPDIGIILSPSTIEVSPNKENQTLSFSITNNDDEEFAIAITPEFDENTDFDIEIISSTITGGGSIQKLYLSEMFVWDGVGYKIITPGETLSGTIVISSSSAATSEQKTTNLTLWVDPAVQNSDRYSGSVLFKNQLIQVEEDVEDIIVGNDRDEHGCIPSAGYQWCESLQKCYQNWVEECPAVEVIAEPVEEKPLAKEEIEMQQDSFDVSFNEESTLDSVTEFTITDDGFGLIEFTGILDLSGEGVVDAINNLFDAIEISEGVIEIDTTILEALSNQPATLTMKGLAFAKTPKILVDGNEDTEGILSNIEYDPDSGVLTFDVAHFTRFEAVGSESSTVEDAEELVDFDTPARETVTASQERLIFFISIVVILSIVIPLMILLKKRFIKKTISDASVKAKKMEESDVVNEIDSIER